MKISTQVAEDPVIGHGSRTMVCSALVESHL